MGTFFFKQGDTVPKIQTILKDGAGVIVDLTGATVKFKMRSKFDATVKIDSAALVVSPGTDGLVEYQWVTADTNTPGWYDAEWEVVFPGGKIETFPNKGYDTIKIAIQVA